MCGRYTQTAAFDELALRFGITVEDTGLEDLTPRYNVAPSQPVPIVIAHNGGRQLVMARWGFHPVWMKASKLAPSQSVPIVIAHNGGRQLVMARWGFHPVWMKTSTLAPINAKAETVATSPMFQAAVKRHRCLVPADGFYEWKAVPGQRRKQPYYLRLKGGGVFAFAGLYTAADTDANAPATCTIITTTPNDLVASIHNRMPVILERDDEVRWSDARVIDPATVLPCLRPLPSSLMEGYPVSTLVSSPGNEGPRLVQPAS